MIQVRLPNRRLLAHPDYPSVVIAIPESGHKVLALGDQSIIDLFYNYHAAIPFKEAQTFYRNKLGTQSSHLIQTIDGSSDEYLTAYVDINKNYSAAYHAAHVKECLGALSLADKNFIILANHGLRAIPIQGISKNNILFFLAKDRIVTHTSLGITEHIKPENINDYIEEDTIFNYSSADIVDELVNKQKDDPFIRFNNRQNRKIKTKLTFTKIEGLLTEYITIYCSYFSIVETISNLGNFNKILNSIEGLETKGFTALDQDKRSIDIQRRILLLFNKNINNIERNLDSIGLLNCKTKSPYILNEPRFIDHQYQKITLSLDTKQYDFENAGINKELSLFEHVLLSLPKLDIKFKTESDLYRKILTILLYCMYLNEVKKLNTKLDDFTRCAYSVINYGNANFKGGTFSLDVPANVVKNMYRNLDKKILNINPYDPNHVTCNIKKPAGSTPEELNDILNHLLTLKNDTK